MARALCLLIITLNTLFGSDEFIFWAKLIVSNGVISSDNIAISSSMVKGYDSKQIICTIKSDKPSNLSSLEYLNLHKDELFECFIKEQVKILENSITNLNSANYTTELTIIPLRFIVEFKPGSATISKIIR
ncbi:MULTISPECIES: hypothetical protein [Campylobacter]|uniref:Flagellar-associated protein FlgQ n=1 Tax=Campylobacter porcelli TaxID=1660073 RepID=A0ABU7M388_9BACT|nr:MULTISPECIES: hypothetical protein [unclassified Campylobacter]MCR8678849.1 hypothetical protein [Campylobacter sp. RM19072]MCR8695954.1 hypothetical protein [Campylobacter sp. RM19073]MEE3744128.1 hypothetical protein [Campylobacter sp. CX2-4855-23]